MTRALLLDEMFSPDIADQLRHHDHDVVAVSERPELRSVADEELLAQATKQSRGIVTMNIRDFARIDAVWKSQRLSHAGIVLVPASAFPQDRRFIGRLVRALDHALLNNTVPGADELTYVRPPSR